MIKVLHIIDHLSPGGAVRAMAATAKYVNRTGDYKHTVAALRPPEKKGIEIAIENGMTVLPAIDFNSINQAAREADIVQLEWWNSPYLDAFIRQFPYPARIIAWPHVAGDIAPQYLPPALLSYADRVAATSPKCFTCPSIMAMPPEERIKKVSIIFAGADFSRLEGLTLTPHDGFRVGYIGTVDFYKMHPDFVEMSSKINVPGLKVVVCGGGSTEKLKQQAAHLNASEKFEILGYVEDIKSQIQMLDLYGYPLCPDTYASSELNLQEVMFAGIPAVVFPYGGVKELVSHNYTGLVVHSKLEYSQAIEYLYHNSAERRRLGENARRYAQEMFGAENAAAKFDKLYREVINEPKRLRNWGFDSSKKLINQPLQVSDLYAPDSPYIGAARFIDSLSEDKTASIFLQSLIDGGETSIFEIGKEIGEMSELMKLGGINQYCGFYQHDPLLHLWCGIAKCSLGNETEGHKHLMASAYLKQNLLKAAV